MKINSITIPKTQKTAVKREAEKVLRLMNSEFPMMSATKILEFHSVKKVPEFHRFAQNLQGRISREIRLETQLVREKWGIDAYYKAFLEQILNYSAGNCGESARLFQILGQINGINSKKMHMVTKTKDGQFVDEIDHAIHVLSLSGTPPKPERLSKLKDVLIIDPWIGIAEYAPKYEQVISSAYNNLFDIEDGQRLYLCNSNNTDPPFSKFLVEYLEEKFPQLFIKKGEPLIKNRRFDR